MTALRRRQPHEIPRTIIRRPQVQPIEGLPAGLHPVLARVYGARNLSRFSELDYGLNGLPPPSRMKGMEEAVALLTRAIRDGRRILFIGDFDADGATSCALGVHALEAMGAAEVDYLVPNRFEFGYGLTPEIVDKALEREPDLIVTVDNGIASVAGVQAARRHRIQVLITDHHLPGRQLPPAEAIVNPNQPGCDFPSKHLAGVGVLFYVLSAVRAQLRREGWFQRGNCLEPNLADYLDLVAVGTVADVVPLDRVNRILVAQGLARINAGRCRPGLRALLDLAQRKPDRVVSSDLAFGVGPRLNAAGRLEDMGLGIRCLLAEDREEAAELAQRLDDLNRSRRDIERDMKRQALDLLAELELGEELPMGLCLFDERWHQGVIGILASRLREYTSRPVVALAPAGDGEIKGSARSITGLHIRDLLDHLAVRHEGLLDKFGGHAMAAGLSLRRERLDQFRSAFEEEVARHLKPEDLRDVILSDGELAPEDLDLGLAEQLRAGGPWGQGFPEPVFDGVFEIVQRRVVGEHHLKMVVTPDGGRRTVDAIAFNWAPKGRMPEWERMRAAYRLDVNFFNDRRQPQLVIEYMEPC